MDRGKSGTREARVGGAVLSTGNCGECVGSIAEVAGFVKEEGVFTITR